MKANGKYNDPLVWWKAHQLQFPNLVLLACDFLSIPATPAPSERVWSRSSRVLTCRRAKLSPDITSRMMFIRENAKLLHKHYERLTGIPLSQAFLPPVDDKQYLQLDVGTVYLAHNV